MINTYLQYGVSIDLATKLDGLNLPKTTFEKTSKRNLIDLYKLSEQEVDIINELIKRDPIDENVIQSLLENSNFICCVCKGEKSDSYIIHHIEHYSKSQDNSYYNLAVLCPNDHELAHKEGKSLTLKLTPKQILKSKENWEREVEAQKVQRAAINGNIHEIEFLNVPRILEVCNEHFHEIPKTKYTDSLVHDELIKNDGHLNIDKISTIASNPSTPLIFFAPFGSTKLRFNYFELFKSILSRFNFRDLDELLNRTSIKEGIVGEYCYYVGGLYSKKVDQTITENSEMVKFYFKRKQFQVEWLVDPKYFASSSAKHRTAHRNIYLIYGKIMNTDIQEIDGKRKIVLDIRPYCFGLPYETKHRKPDIAYAKEYDELFDEYEDDEGENIA